MRTRHIETDLHHRLLKELAVFTFRDRLGLSTDHFDTVLLENTLRVEIH